MKILSIFLFIFLTITVHIFHMAHSDDQVDALRVLWTVSEYKILDKSKISEHEAVAFLSKPLDINETSITFDGNTCSNIFFQKNEVDSKDYFLSHFNIMPHEIGIKDPILQVVNTSCNLPGFSEYLRLPNRQIVIFKNGIFLFFSPWVNY